MPASPDKRLWSGGREFDAASGNIAAQASQAPRRAAWQEGAAVTGGQIQALVLDTRLEMTAFGSDTSHSVTMLLDNGLAYRGLTSEPSALTLPSTDRTSWGDGSPWTLWRPDESGQPELSSGPSDSGWQPVEGRQIDPGHPGDASADRLAGSYERTRARNLGGTVVSSNEAITLHPDGRFQVSNSSLATGSPSAPASEPGGFQAVGRTREGGSGDPSRRGSYRLLDDGFGIELTHDDGTVTRELFFSHQDRIFLGDRSYGRSDRSGGAPGGDTGPGATSSGSGAFARTVAAMGDASSEASDSEQRGKRLVEALAAASAKEP